MTQTRRGPVEALVVHWGRWGGGPRFTLELATALRGVLGEGRVALSTSRDAELAPEVRRWGPGHQVHTYTSVVSFVLRLLALPSLAAGFRRYLRRSGTRHVVCGMGSLYQSLVVPLVVPRGVTYYYCVHDADFHPGEGNVVQRVGRFLELRRADVLVCFSAEVAHKLEQSGRVGARRLVRTVHPAYTTQGVEVLGGRPGPVHTPPVVGFLGRFTPYKGLDLLVEYAELVGQRGEPVVVQAHGSGSFAGLEDLMRTTAIDWHHGWIGEDEFAVRLDGFDVLLLPYREASQSGVLAQALSLGVPAVVTPVGGLAEQVTRSGGGLVAAETTAAALADAVTRVLTDVGVYAELSRAALASASSDFSWDQVAADLQAAMERSDELGSGSPPLRP